jgi:hypothetical protein
LDEELLGISSIRTLSTYDYENRPLVFSRVRTYTRI